MKKILITGVFASGKTSLIELLKISLENMGMKVASFNEVARECPFDLNHKQNLISTSWLVMSQLENEIKIIDENYDFIIYDRGIPDIVAHTRFILEGDSEGGLIYEKLEGLGKASLDNFHYTFLSMRSDKFNIQVDNMRVDDVSYQRELEKIQIDYLKKIKANYTLLDEDNNDRVMQILSIIL